MTNFLHLDDLPDHVANSITTSVAIDTEAMGLKIPRDKLCVVQLSTGDGNAHLVKYDLKNYNSPNLVRILTDESILKIFHYGRFDIAIMKQYLGASTKNVYCTKIASKLTRTYTESHGLRTLCDELLGVEISKKQQSSNWGADTLTHDQIKYAASDVLHLHKLKTHLDKMLERHGREEIAKACFKFLESTRVDLDLIGFDTMDIFSH